MTNKSERTRIGVFAGIFGILTNLLAFAVKIVVGVLSGSVTVAADAVNSLTDAGSSILTMIGFKLSSKPADREHPYGHARYEQITALIISLIMLAVGLLFAKSSIEKIIHPTELNIGILTYSALIAAIVLKLIQAAVNFNLAKKIDSGALHAAALDSRNDALITASVLVSVIIMGAFGKNIDGWAGLLVSLFIIWSSAMTVKSAISPMLGAPPSSELVEAVEKIVMSRPEILGYHDLVIHNYGSGANFGSIHCEVDGRGNVAEIHDIIDGIENQIGAELGVVLTIHMDPVLPDGKDEKTDET